jgi:hypothetical protein
LCNKFSVNITGPRAFSQKKRKPFRHTCPEGRRGWQCEAATKTLERGTTGSGCEPPPEARLVACNARRGTLEQKGYTQISLPSFVLSKYVHNPVKKYHILSTQSQWGRRRAKLLVAGTSTGARMSVPRYTGTWWREQVGLCPMEVDISVGYVCRSYIPCIDKRVEGDQSQVDE